MLLNTDKTKVMFITTSQKRLHLHENVLRLTYKSDILKNVNNDKILGVFIDKNLTRRMAENGFAPPPPPREFCRHILSCRELKAESFKRCLHSVLRGVSL